MLNGHMNHMSSLRIMPIVQLSKKAATHTGLPTGQEGSTYIQHVIEKIKVLTIQPTSRTDDLGKWLILIRAEHYQRAEDYVDIEIPRTFSKDIPAEYHLPGFPSPRRTKIPLRAAAMGTYANTLTALSANGLKLPQVPSPKIWAKPKQVYFHQDKGDFPHCRQRTSKQKEIQQYKVEKKKWELLYYKPSYKKWRH